MANIIFLSAAKVESLHILVLKPGRSALSASASGAHAPRSVKMHQNQVPDRADNVQITFGPTRPEPRGSARFLFSLEREIDLHGDGATGLPGH